MSNTKLLSAIVISVLTLSLHAQLTSVDSLNNLLQNHKLSNAPIDTTYVKTLLNLSKAILKSDNTNALKNAKLALKLSDSLDYEKGIGYSYYAIGNCYKANRKLDEAIINFNKAAEVYNSINDVNRMGRAKSRAGICNCFKGDLEKGLKIFEETLVIFRKSNNKIGLADTYNLMGNVYDMIGESELSEKSYLQSLKIRKEIGERSRIADLLYNLGVFYDTQDNYYKALDSYLEALQVYDSIGNKELISKVLNGLGNVYISLSDDSIAMGYYNQSLVIATELNDKETKANCLTNLGSLEGKSGNYIKAIELYKEAYVLLEELGNTRNMASNINNQAIIHKNLNNYNESINLSKQALKLAKESNDKHGKCTAGISLSNTYYLMEEYSISKKNSLIALKLAEELNSLTYQIEAYYILSNIHEKENQPGLALLYYKTYKVLEDSLFNENSIKRITGLEYKYEFDKEKQTIYLEQQKKDALQEEKLKRQTQQRNTFIIGFSLVLILVFVVYKSYLQKRKANKKLIKQNTIIKKQKEEKELLVKEIHHRVKNNLQIISSLFDLQMRGTDNPDTKSSLIDGLNRVKSVGLIHQLLYQSDDVINIDFNDFVTKLVEHITSFATDKPINKEVIIPEGLQFDIITTIPLGLIITELLTNSFKYAFDYVETCSISIKLEKINNYQFKLEVIDNGIGLPDEFDFSKSKSLGLSLVRTLSKQLTGTIEYKFDQGANFVLVFSRRIPHE